MIITTDELVQSLADSSVTDTTPVYDYLERVVDKDSLATAQAIVLDFLETQGSDVTALTVDLNTITPTTLVDHIFKTVPLYGDAVELRTKVSVPSIYKLQPRSTDGSLVTNTKSTLLDLVVDTSILAEDDNRLVPVATSPTTPAALVPSAVIPDKTEMIGGTIVNTRPIAVGVEVDLVGISSHTNLPANDMDEFTYLSDVFGIKELFYSITLVDLAGTSQTIILSNDVSRSIQALFHRTAEGSKHDRALHLATTANYSSTNPVISGNVAAFNVLARTALGISAATEFNLSGGVDISGKVNVEVANAVVYGSSTGKVTYADSNGNKGVAANFDGLAYDLQVTVLGYTPNARFTNLFNMDYGLYVSLNNGLQITLPVNIQSPISVMSPTKSISAEGLNVIKDIADVRTTNSAIQAVIDLDTALSSGHMDRINGMPGSTLVKPAYTNRNLTVAGLTTTGSDRVSELAHNLVNTLITVNGYLLHTSGYLNALQVYTGLTVDFKVVIMGDPMLTALLYREGDGRTVGNSGEVDIVPVNTKSMLGKLYMFYTTITGKGSMLDFGVRVTSKGECNTVETKIPSKGFITSYTKGETFYVFSPILGVVTVADIESLYL